MSQRRPIHPCYSHVEPAIIGTAVTRAGLTVVIATLPVVLGTAAGMLADAASFSLGIQAIFLALEESPSPGTGLASLFRLSSLGLFAGVWLLGIGLVVEGLFD